MAELLSLTASIIGLFQGIELARKSYNLIYGIKGAPKEARRINAELNQINGILEEIEQFAQRTPGVSSFNNSDSILQLLNDVSKLFKDDIKQFQAMVDRHVPQKTSWARNKLRLKWAVGLDRKLTQMSSRLVAHTGRLQLVLSLYQSDEMRVSTIAIQQQLSKIRQSHDSQAVARAQHLDPAMLAIPHSTTTLLYGSAELCADVLNTISPTIYTLLSSSHKSVVSASQAEWALQNTLYGALTELMVGRIKTMRNVPPRPALPDSVRFSNRTKPNPFRRTAIFTSNKTPALQNLTSVEVHDKGYYINLALLSHKIPNDFNIVTRGRLHVELERPSSASRIGASVSVFEAAGMQTVLFRHLIAFNVHPNASAIFSFIRDGDIAAVQRLISLGAVSPNDRDEDGHSLLWHSLSNPSFEHSYGVCEFLLQQNADPSSCNRNGDHAASLLIRRIEHEDQLAEGMRLIDLLVHYSPISEAESTLRYKRRKGVDQAPASLLHSTIFLHRCGIVAHIPHLLGKLIRSGADLEMADKHGNTVLLYTLFYTPVASLVMAASQLLEAGAYVHAKNSHGEGVLHLLLRRLSACSIPDMNEDVKSGIITLLVRLLEKGCDPLDGNTGGYTPIDAAMSPVAWPLFSAAIQKAGKDMKKEFQLLDATARVTISEDEVERKTKEAIKHRAVAKEAQFHKQHLEIMGNGAPACNLCNRRPDPSLRAIPFDEFFSDVVDELGQGIHMIMNNHDDMDECLHIHEEDPTHMLDYHPSSMSPERLKERSWRRHVAWKLWERGFLDS
ncbi:hypothetical protein QBC38DRAFT_449386 [Podospora fimiseda]|uniref:Fungal N-terminal domain-containing protein n=1 Tax=Podospora fimiseda TaxID=252190 RepID=A0AAN6YKW8_9PEZI|nr:hypothetical protein QBC38DRAFT_449386 [Podospora fimiseda]